MMKPRLRDLLILIATATPLIAGVSWLVLRRPQVQPPAPTLRGIREFARARQFDQALSMLDTYMLSHPTDESGHLLMAELTTGLAKPQPEVALDHLQKIHPETSERAALVEFFKGKAHYQQTRYDLAEDCWTEAIRLHPSVPEAGWALFDLISLEGRMQVAHELGVRLHEIEPDPRDRVRFLIELIHIDIDKSAPGSIVLRFQSLAEKVPENLTIASTYGLALVHDSRVAEGLEVLRASLKRHSDSPDAWNAWLTGLEDAGQSQEHATEFARLPKAFRTDNRFLRHEGLAAQGSLDWQRASRAYQRAVDAAPYDGVLLYRLSRSLRLAGNKEESDRVDKLLKDHQTAYKNIRAVVTEISSLGSLGYEPQPELYQQLAKLREQMGRFDDALAWHRLVIRDRPDNATSLKAIARLTSENQKRLQ